MRKQQNVVSNITCHNQGKLRDESKNGGAKTGLLGLDGICIFSKISHTIDPFLQFVI